jgi:hypothetical protein
MTLFGCDAVTTGCKAISYWILVSFQLLAIQYLLLISTVSVKLNLFVGISDVRHLNPGCHGQTITT